MLAEKRRRRRRAGQQPLTGLRLRGSPEGADLDLGHAPGVDELAVVLAHAGVVADVLEGVRQALAQEDLVAVAGAQHHAHQPPGLEAGLAHVLLAEAVGAGLHVLEVVREPVVQHVELDLHLQLLHPGGGGVGHLSQALLLGQRRVEALLQAAGLLLEVAHVLRQLVDVALRLGRLGLELPLQAGQVDLQQEAVVLHHLGRKRRGVGLGCRQ